MVAKVNNKGYQIIKRENYISTGGFRFHKTFGCVCHIFFALIIQIQLQGNTCKMNSKYVNIT